MRAPSDAARRLLRVAVGAALVTTLMLVVPAGHRLVAGSGPVQAVYQLGYYVCMVAALAAVLLRAASGGRYRHGWLLVGLTQAAYLLGDLTWFAVVRGQVPEPYPSVADAFYLAQYPAAFAGLVLLFRRQVGRTAAAVWLDGVIAGLGLGAVAARFAFAEVVRIGSGGTALVVTNLAYPVGDLVLLVVVTSILTILRGSAGLRWLLLLGGFVVLAGTDSTYLVRLAQDSYRSPSLLDQGWPFAFLLVALAAWAPQREDRAGRGVTPMAMVPLSSAAAATGVMAASNVGTSPVPIVLAASAVLLTLVRLALTLQQVTSLAHTRRLARTDELTGLPNRRAFYERAQHLNDAHAGDGRAHAVLLVDLDRFKEVNDSFGHHVGDDLLRLVGPRLAAQVGPDDLIARLGGDEFGIVVLGHDPAEAVAERLCASLEQPFTLADVTVQISASIGVAHYPRHGTDGTTLLRRADVAMYAAKRARTGWRSYAAAEDPNSPERLHLLDDLRTELAHGGTGLELHYQPKVRLADDRLSGVEALVRWRHPVRGLLPPGEFLPLVEEYGLSRSLTDAVLLAALGQCSRWRDLGLVLPVAVNLPAALCTDPELPDRVAALLTRLDLPPALLELEITEEFMLGDRHRARTVLTRLGELGVRVSIDDFGTGYSSLAYLRDLPVDQLKLDRTFVADAENDPTSAALVRSTVSLAHSLGLEMVAEGVETPGVLALLREVGCDQAQGYFLGRPMPAARLQEWLGARSGEVPVPQG
jgi:diguanylate cyclase (GGDEF)-like protein